MEHKTQSEILNETIDRLLQADAAYKEFVKTTRSYQLAVEGLNVNTERER